MDIRDLFSRITNLYRFKLRVFLRPAKFSDFTILYLVLTLGVVYGISFTINNMTHIYDSNF